MISAIFLVESTSPPLRICNAPQMDLNGPAVEEVEWGWWCHGMPPQPENEALWPSLKLTFSHLKMNGWNMLEYYFPIGMAYFQWRAVSFKEGNHYSVTLAS